MNELFNKLHRITQGSRSVKEYVWDMEVTLNKVKLKETPMATMTRFLNGLNREREEKREKEKRKKKEKKREREREKQ